MTYHDNGFSPQKYVKIARDLHYSQSVINKLKEVKNEEEATRILLDARKEKE